MNKYKVKLEIEVIIETYSEKCVKQIIKRNPICICETNCLSGVGSYVLSSTLYNQFVKDIKQLN